MTSRDLAAKYAEGKNVSSHRLVNRAIRAEIPGGSEALQLLEDLRKRYDRDSALGRVALEGVRRIIGRMVYAIRQRYGMSVDPSDAPEAQESGDSGQESGDADE